MLKTPRLITALFTCGIALTISLASCDNKTKSADTASTAKTAPSAAGTPASGKIAYVDMDTLMAKYEYFKIKKAAFEKQTAAMDAEVERMAQSLQSEYNAFQKKAQAGTLSQADGEAGQQKLQQMQQNIESKRQSLGAQLMKAQEEFNKELQQQLDDYLVKYNADKGYDYILSYAKGGSILFANKALDITADVIKGMNEDKGKSAEATK